MNTVVQRRRSSIRAWILAFTALGALTLRFAVGAVAAVNPDSLRHWVVASEQALAADHWEGIDAESARWISRLDSTDPPRPELLVEVLRVRLAARSAQGLGADDVSLATARRLVALVDELKIADERSVAAFIGLGAALSTRGEYSAARAPLQRAVTLADSLAPNSALLGTALSHHAWNLRLMGRLDESEEVALRSLHVRQALGPDQDAATSWNFGQLASIALARGDAARALEYNSSCLRVRERVYGPSSIWTADACEMQGWILTQQGEYPRADTYYLRALDIFESAVGEKSDRVARVLNDLGVSASYQAQNDVARRYYERALQIRTELFGADNVSVAQTLHNLGIVLADMDDRSAALERQREALGILAKNDMLGSEDALLCRNVIVGLLSEEGKFDEARSAARVSLAQATKHLGPASIPALSARLMLIDVERKSGHVRSALADADTAVVLADSSGIGPLRAAALYARAQCKPANEAFADADSALSIRVRVLGKYHPDTVRSALLRAELELGRGDRRRALEDALETEVWSQRHAASLFDGFAQRQALRYASARPCGLGLALRCLGDGRSPEGDAIWRFWDAVASSRQLVMRAMVERSRAASEKALPSRDRLQAARGRVARLVMASLRSDGGASPAQIQTAIEEREKLERAVGDSLDASGTTTVATRASSVEDVAAAMEEDEALVGFRRIEVGPDQSEYIALLAWGGRRPPVLVSLGDASAIDAAIETWNDELSRGEMRPDRSPRASRQFCEKAGLAVRHMVWDPVARQFENVTRIHVVPDAELWKIPWAALPDDDGNFLLDEEIDVRTILSEGDLTERALGLGHVRDVLLVGGVDFSSSPAALLARSKFRDLPGAVEEIERIDEVWRGAETLRLEQDAASEARVRLEMQHADLIHLATHAVYLEPDGEDAFLVDHPLLRGGLVFAGQSGAGPENDGWLSAEEVCGLDLHRSRLVVLSACSTARGGTPTGEAILGLVWAFRVAGTANLVLTGWDVGDRDAQLWMEAFHRALREGMPIGPASRASSRRLLAELRSHGRSTHPYHWAAFRSLEMGH